MIDCQLCAHWDEFTSYSERQIWKSDGTFIYEPESREIKTCSLGHWIGRDHVTGPYVVDQCRDFLTVPGVTVLFARSDSIYYELGCDVWDIERDARLFCGANPVIAHPPCRAWGQLSHLAKPRRGERALARLALDWVRRNGGVLEHPIRSRLFVELIGWQDSQRFDAWGGWLLPMDQYWAGHPAQKATRLYVCGIRPRDIPAMPFALGTAPRVVSTSFRFERQAQTGVTARKSLSSKQCEATPRLMAEWLVELAARCKAP